MRIIKTLALAAPLLAPQPALAADLTVQGDAQVEYDDNAFRGGGEEDDDVLFRLRPQVKLHEDRGHDLTYALTYAVPFEFAAQHGDELDDIDHEVRADAKYHVSHQLQVWGMDRFRYLRSALRDVGVDDALAGEGTLLINQERERTTLNSAEAGASYQFTPRLSGSLRGSHEYFDTDREDRSENWMLAGIADMSYALTPRHTVGGGVRVIRQEFEESDTVVASAVTSYNAFAQWTYRLDETLSFSIAAGPTWIDNDQDDPDAMRTVATIPSIPAPAGAEASQLNVVDPAGNQVFGPVPAGSIIVSQLAGCPVILQTSQPVFTTDGGICAILPGLPGILLRPLDDPVEFALAQTPNVVTNPFPIDDDDTSLTAYGEAVIAKHWTETLHSALRYNRTQGGASGLGGAVVSDAVSLSNTWDFAERWQLAVRGDWIQRESVSTVSQQFITAGDPGGAFAVIPAGTIALVTVGGGDSEIDTTRYGGAGRLTHRFTRNTSGWVQFTYNEQTSRGGTLGDPSDFTNVLATIGVRHVFEPIKLW